MVATEGEALGLYISIPFCRSKCAYCNFASGIYPASVQGRYVDRLVEDLAAARAWAERMGVELPRRVDTVYLGGGTPSLLAPEQVTRLFAAMRAEFELAPGAEITVECAPGQLAGETLEALQAAGMNRASLGVQSFIDREARVSGRRHSRAVALEEIQRLREAGITNLNVDLIAGLAGQTLASWEESLAVLASSGVPHASVYMFEVDEDSRLGREVLAHGTRFNADLVPTDDAMAQMYQVATERLARAGLEQYEISNFCRPGMESRHNRRYWQRRPYLGVGLEASSMLCAASAADFRAAGSSEFSPTNAPCARNALCATNAPCARNELGAPSSRHPELAKRVEGPAACFSGKRAGNHDSQPASAQEKGSSQGRVLRSTATCEMKAFLAGSEPVETTWLRPQQQHEEAWFLGLRLNEGVEVAAVEREFGPAMVAPALKVVRRLAEAGLVVFDGQRVRLTARGRLLSNEVFQEFLGLKAEDGETGLETRR